MFQIHFPHLLIYFPKALMITCVKLNNGQKDTLFCIQSPNQHVYKNVINSVTVITWNS